MTQTKVQESAKPTIQTIERISFDLGNRFNAITNGSKIAQYPSYSCSLSIRQDLDYSSAGFKQNQSFRVDIGAIAVAVGKVASDLNANPTFGGDKWLKAKEFLFAGLKALGIETTAHIKELRVTTPDDQDPEQRSPFEALAKRTHQFKVNGKEYNVRIDKVLILPEGKAAWLRARNEGLYLYPQMLNAVLDLGGGTAIARIYSAEGMIQRDRELVLQGGTSSLASQIASEIGMRGSESMIMDAIADGSYKLPFCDFKATFEAFLPKWVEGIRNEMNTAWKPIQNKYAQILVVGGSAPLMAEFVKDNPRYIIAPNPQTFALEGLQNG